MNIVQTLWNGSDIYLFKLVNDSGAYVELSNYGATIVSIVVPDRNDNLISVALGFPSFEGYGQDESYIGSTIGRFANRIGGGSFVLNGKRFSLDRNDGQNSNHSGKAGFHAKVFSFQTGTDTITFWLSSSDGEGGFPGNVQFEVKYSWNNENELSIVYTATTDQTTVMNFTNHAYFNLEGEGNILDHNLTVFADTMLEADSSYIPTGTIRKADVASGVEKSIQERIKINGGSGLNSYYLFNTQRNNHEMVCQLKNETSGIQLRVFTSLPGVQLYSGDYLMSKHAGHNGKPYKSLQGLCLECQFPPDSPNHANFLSTVVDAGSEFNHYILYKFDV